MSDNYYSTCPKCGGEATSGGYSHRQNCSELNIKQEVTGFYSFEYMKPDQQTVFLLKEILKQLKIQNGIKD